MKPFQTSAPCANWVEITNIEARANSRKFVRKARQLVKVPTLWERVCAFLGL